MSTAAPRGYFSAFSESLRINVLCPNGWKMVLDESGELYALVRIVPLHPQHDGHSSAELLYVAEQSDSTAAEFMSSCIRRLHCHPITLGETECEGTIERDGRQMNCLLKLISRQGCFHAIQLLFCEDEDPSFDCIANEAPAARWRGAFDVLCNHLEACICNFELRDAIVVRSSAAYWRAAVPFHRFKSALFNVGALPVGFPPQIAVLWDGTKCFHAHFSVDCGPAVLSVLQLPCPGGVLNFASCCSKISREASLPSCRTLVDLTRPHASGVHNDFGFFVVPPAPCTEIATLVVLWGAACDGQACSLAADFVRSLHFTVRPSPPNSPDFLFEVFIERLKSCVRIPFGENEFTVAPSRFGNGRLCLVDSSTLGVRCLATLFLVADGRTCDEWLEYVEQESQNAAEQSLVAHRSDGLLDLGLSSGESLRYHVQRAATTQFLIGISIRASDPATLRRAAALDIAPTKWLAAHLSMLRSL